MSPEPLKPSGGLDSSSPAAVSPIQPTGRTTPLKIPEELETLSGEDDDCPGRTRKGTMSRNFRFPYPTAAAARPFLASNYLGHIVEAEARAEAPQIPPKAEGDACAQPEASPELTTIGVVAPSSVEVPPPPPVDKERPLGSANEFVDDVGETEEISLN